MKNYAQDGNIWCKRTNTISYRRKRDLNLRRECCNKTFSCLISRCSNFQCNGKIISIISIISAWNSGAPALGAPWTLPTLPTPLLVAIRRWYLIQIILHDAGVCNKPWATTMLTFTSVLGLLNVAALRYCCRLKADVFRLYRPIVQRRNRNTALRCAIDAMYRRDCVKCQLCFVKCVYGVQPTEQCRPAALLSHHELCDADKLQYNALGLYSLCKTDSPDCLPILLSISVFSLYSSCSPLLVFRAVD